MRRRTLIINCITAIIYIFLFREIYTNYLAVLCSNYGYRVCSNAGYEILFTDVLLLIPILFYKAKKNPSDFISIFIYIIIYVPSLIALQYYYKDYMKAVPYQITFFFAQILFFISYKNSISKHSFSVYENVIPFKIYLIFGVIIGVFVLLFYSGRLSFVSFQDVYDLRSANHVIESSYPIIGYMNFWTEDFFCPLFIAIGCYKHNNKYIILGFVLGLLIYMATGLKNAITTPFITMAVYYILKNEKMKSLEYFFPIVITSFLIIYILNDKIGGVFLGGVSFLLFMRTIGVSALFTPAYIDVFSRHPYTYYSHISVVNGLTNMYPFHNPSLGNAVWATYTGNPDAMNANANFMVTDGIAACGILGMIIITIVFYYLLAYLNKLSNNHDQTIVLTLLVGSISSLTNVSLFTTFITSGLLFCMIFLRYTKIKNE
jgi:hypothetical protein